MREDRTDSVGPKDEEALTESPSPKEIAGAHEPPLTLGSCVLRRLDVGSIVQNALLHFEGDRYWLKAWCVMPNHVHVVVAPRGNHQLADVLHSWKSFTSTKINKLIGASGALWERESFNHLIRRSEHVREFVQYTEENPVKAGLCREPAEWFLSNCGAGFQPARTGFVSPNETPFVVPRTRGELPHLHKPGGTYFITWRLLDAVELRRV